MWSGSPPDTLTAVLIPRSRRAESCPDSGVPRSNSSEDLPGIDPGESHRPATDFRYARPQPFPSPARDAGPPGSRRTGPRLDAGTGVLPSRPTGPRRCCRPVLTPMCSIPKRTWWNSSSAPTAKQRTICVAPSSRRCPICGRPPPDRLAETLRSWLVHQGQRDAVAADLFVHAQTVRYRMTQLRELFGERLNDPRRGFGTHCGAVHPDDGRFTPRCGRSGCRSWLCGRPRRAPSPVTVRRPCPVPRRRPPAGPPWSPPPNALVH